MSNLVELTQQQKEEMVLIGNLYRKTILEQRNLPNIVKAFAEELKKTNGDIALTIYPEVMRFHHLITSSYIKKMRKRIDGIYNNLSNGLPNDVLFRIYCRQKSWESVLRKIINNYFEGISLDLYDLIALKIVLDSDRTDLEQQCYVANELVIQHCRHQLCTLLTASKKVGNNPLIKDYIAHPKKNGYKAIHLAFRDIDKDIFEVQIKTELWDCTAECDIVKKSKKQTHSEYKANEYALVTPYIYFDSKEVSIPHFRTYCTQNGETIVRDEIGLKYAKPVEYRAKTY